MIFNETTKAIMRKMFAGEITNEEGLRQLDEAGAVSNGYMNDALLPNPHLDDEE